MLESIPVTDLAADEPIPFAGTDLCVSVPADVVTPDGGTLTQVTSDSIGCVWHGSGLSLDIGAEEGSMAKEIESHLTMANGGSTDRLAHLAWLRIDGHYAIERIMEFDRTKSCWLTLDVSALATFHVVVTRIERAKSDTGTRYANSVRSPVRLPRTCSTTSTTRNQVGGSPHSPNWVVSPVLHPALPRFAMLPGWKRALGAPRGEDHMPFWTGETDTGPSAATSTLRVEPDQVLRLKSELQSIYDEVDEFLNTQGRTMSMQPLGADAVSRETAQAFNDNTQSALEAANGYLRELRSVLNALDQAARTYNLVEDANTHAFRQANQ